MTQLGSAVAEGTAALPAGEPIVRIPAPAPGVYPGVPFSEYQRWDAVNKSTLDWLIDYSPKHAHWHYWNETEKETPALLMGRAFHTAVLEPAKFPMEFCVAEQCHALTKKGERCSYGGSLLVGGKWYCKTHAPDGQEPEERSILKPEQRDLVDGMVRAIGWNRMAKKFIDDGDQNELSIVWRDKVTGLTCKARIDMDRPSWDCIGDLKTCECASMDAFTRSFTSYSYHRQAAFYLDGCNAVGLKRSRFAIIAVEKAAPYGVATFSVSSTAIDAGRKEIEAAMLTWARCKRDEEAKVPGAWPTYDNDFPLISLMPHEMRRIFSDEVA